MKTNPPIAELEIDPVSTDAPPTILKLRRERSSPSRAQGPRGPLQPLRHRWYLRGKAVADFVLATLICIPALPLVALAALAVELTSRGPAFYTQTRLGLFGQPFTIYKLRTMIHNCESLTGPRWSMPGDPRITPLGWLLRATHIDELPQILNVLRGEMSLIGPRPERPEFAPELERALPAYRQRLQVRPGVTGLAQVQLPPDTDLGSVRKKLAHDLYYIRYLSPGLDVRLLACTACYALGIPFRVLSKVLRVPDGATVERAMQDMLVEAPPVRARMSA